MVIFWSRRTCLIPNHNNIINKKFNIQFVIKKTCIVCIFKGKRERGKEEGGRGKGMLKKKLQEALSFPAAGSLRRQLVSQKRGRAGSNNEAVQVNGHLTLPLHKVLVSVFLLELLRIYTNPGSERLSQVRRLTVGFLGGIRPSGPTNAKGYGKKVVRYC